MIVCPECMKQIEKLNLCPHCGYQHRTGKVVIGITKETKEKLIGFLLEDRMETGEGYSDFINISIEMRRLVQQLAGGQDWREWLEHINVRCRCSHTLAEHIFDDKLGECIFLECDCRKFKSISKMAFIPERKDKA